MTRQDAYQTLLVYTKAPNLINHHLAAEAAMRAIAKYYASKNQITVDIEPWGLTGLLHDADYELTRNTPEKHTLYLEEKIGNSLPKDVMTAIKAHNFAYTKIKPVTPMDWAMYTCDELTGFVIACTLVQKNKKMSEVTVDFILKKMGDYSFAKSVDRKQILLCEQALNIPVKTYIQIVLSAMQAIATTLGFAT